MDIGANDVFKEGCTTLACLSGVLAGIEANLRFIYAAKSETSPITNTPWWR
jgi:hypothetical protein